MLNPGILGAGRKQGDDSVKKAGRIAQWLFANSVSLAMMGPHSTETLEEFSYETQITPCYRSRNAQSL